MQAVRTETGYPRDCSYLAKKQVASSPCAGGLFTGFAGGWSRQVAASSDQLRSFKSSLAISHDL